MKNSSPLFRHYKQKFYKYRGLVKHSETLEDLALYDCLYENSSGQEWVRPKELFFGTTEVSGRVIPRFEQIPIDIEKHTGVQDEDFGQISAIAEKVLSRWNVEDFFKRYEEYQNFLLVLAKIEGRVVGFKLGHEKSEGVFYSWIGGVLPEYRGLGIASMLMKAQHDWCVEQDYKVLETKSQNNFKSMMALNLKFGFDIVGTADPDRKGLRILFSKKLKTQT